MNMFELEDYSTGYHDGFLNKYTDSSRPMLDLYLSDSMQDMLDIDIRSEIANVVGGYNDYDTLLASGGGGGTNGDLPSIFDHAMDTITSSVHNSNSDSNSNNNSTSTTANHDSNSISGSNISRSGGVVSGNSVNNSVNSIHSAANWMGTGPSWAASNDFFVDVGACVNPISVMPLISSHMLHKSPKVSLNANGLRSGSTANSPPASPTGGAAESVKSHLTFSPAQMKLSAGSLRNEQILSHIPKQIVSISSTAAATATAPATLASNSLLHRKSNVSASGAAVDAIRKDLGAELKRIGGSGAMTTAGSTTTSNTIKLAPGIGGLTFANTVTYNKLKQQATTKSPQGSPVTANGTIVLKRDRDSSPLHHMTTLNGGGSKLLGRNVLQAAGSSFTPKSIASAHSPLMQSGNGGRSSPAATVVATTVAATAVSSNSFSGTFTAVAPSSTSSTGVAASYATTTAAPAITSIAVKPLQQKIKSTPVESEYPKPGFPYSCLIAMALKNSRSGLLPVSEIYSFMCEHFPYFQSAPNVWKNSVRHNLSLNKCFDKIEKPATNGSQRKGCLWALKPECVAKMDGEVQKWSRKDPIAIRSAMVYPEHLEALERGEMKHGSSADSDVELDSQSEIEETSDLEEHDLDEAIADNMLVEEDFEEDEEEFIEEHEVETGGERQLNTHNRIVVINSAEHVAATGGNGSGSSIAHNNDQHRDFDIEVEDIYDAIDMEDDKDAAQMSTSPTDIIELNPAELSAPRQHHNSIDAAAVANVGYQSPKRARLSINYSIGPTGELEKQIQKHQIHLHPHIKHIKVQTLQQVVQQQHQQQQLHQQQAQLGTKPQHVIVQTISNGGATTALQLATAQQFQQLTAALPMHNRRKMQLVNRIA